MLEQLAQRSKKREYHGHAEDPRQRRPPPAEKKADGDDRGVNGYASEQTQDVPFVFRRDRRGSFRVRLTKQQHLDCPYSKGRLQEKEQIEREEIGEFRVARGAQLPMMLEMDRTVQFDRGADQPGNGKIANAIAAVFGCRKIVMRPLVQKELEIGHPIADKAGPEQRGDELWNTPGRSNNRQAERRSQKDVTDGNVAVDNRVSWFQLTNESNITFAIAAYQLASQRGECTRIVIGPGRCGDQIVCRSLVAQ